MSKSGIKPLGYRVLILPDEVESVTAGGIIIPDSAKDVTQEAQFKGTIMALGKDAFDRCSTKPKVGDSVFYTQYEGVLQEGVDGKEYRIINDDAVNAMLVNNKVVPLWYNVLIDPEKVEESSVIKLPDDLIEREQIKQTKGKVKAIAADAYFEDSLHVNDEVTFTRYAGSILKHEGVYRLCKDVDVGAILTKED